jgi:hypothetical protein
MLNEGKPLEEAHLENRISKIPWTQHGARTLRGPFRTINVLQEPCDQAPHALDGRFVMEAFSRREIRAFRTPSMGLRFDKAVISVKECGEIIL